MRFARIDAGRVAEMIEGPLDGRFHPDVIAACVPAGEDVAEGWTWDGVAFAAPPGPSTDALAAAARAQRNALLAACDWTQLPDAPAGVGAAWAPYRAALRDVPAQPGFPADITWPVAPG